MKLKRMTVTIILLTLAIALIAGCSSPKPTATPTPTASPSPTTAAPKPTTAAPTTSAAPSPAAKVITLKVAGTAVAAQLQAMQEDANKLIEQRAGGRIKIDYYPKDTLIKGTQVFDSAPAGVVDIAMTSAAYAPDLMSMVADISNMPFNFDLDLFAKNYRNKGGYYDFVQPYWQKVNLYLLSWPLTGASQLASRAPIHNIADMKGKLVRTVAGGAADFVNALGAKAVPLGAEEVYEALQKGTIDANIFSMSTMRSRKIYEVAPYFTLADISQASFLLVMSTKARQSLPADIVKIIDEAYLEAEKKYYPALGGVVKADNEFIKAQPKVKEVYQLPPDEKARWAEKAQGVYDAFAKKYGAEWQKFWEIRKSLFQ